MAELLSDKVIIRSIGQATIPYHRLILPVAPTGGGKNDPLQEDSKPLMWYDQALTR